MTRIARNDLRCGNHRSAAQTSATIGTVIAEEVLEVAQVL